MKRLWMVLIALIAFDVSAMEIDRYTSGAWYNPSQSGHGYSIEVMPDNQVLIYWYVYNPDGTPTFLLAIGESQGDRVHADVYHHTGMKFGEFDNSNLIQTHWGTLDFTVQDCNNARINYSSTMSQDGVPFGSGTILIQRLSSIDGLKCTESPLYGNYHVTTVENGAPGFGVAALFENGDMAYLSVSETAGGVGLGSWHQTGDARFAFDATVYSIVGGSSEISGSGDLNLDGLDATYTGGGQLIASKLEQSFQQNLTTGMMAGTYDLNGLGISGSVTIKSNGQVTGSTNDGCTINGWFTVPNTEFNQAYFDVNTSNCAESGRTMGAATYAEDEGIITAIGADGWYGNIWTLE
jgi:hypothetical protein